MSAPATDDLRELARLLVVAAETGEPREFASLQEELALGHDDMAVALDSLREHGQAQELAPGMWSGPDGESRLPNPAPRLTVAAPTPEDDDDEDAAEFGELPRGSTSLLEAGATVRLTVGVAAALDAPALGAIVQAGISEAHEQGLPFVLVVG